MPRKPPLLSITDIKDFLTRQDLPDNIRAYFNAELERRDKIAKVGGRTKADKEANAVIAKTVEKLSKGKRAKRVDDLDAKLAECRDPDNGWERKDRAKVLGGAERVFYYQKDGVKIDLPDGVER